MKNLPKYDSNIPKDWYDSFGEKEWTRLSRNRLGDLLYHVHMDVFLSYIKKGDSVLELGAGAGIFSKELVSLAESVVVSDISEQQLAINKMKMAELGLEERIKDFLLLDTTDLNEINSDHFDIVTCVGGAINYTFDKEKTAISEMLRVVKPGGIVIVGAMSLLNSIIRFLPGVVDEKKEFGIEATTWLFNTGIQDAEHYPVENKNYVHMMKSNDLDTLFEDQNAQIIEKRAAGLFSLAGEEALDQAKADNELWELILKKEVEYSQNPACLDLGANIIYVAKKIRVP